MTKKEKANQLFKGFVNEQRKLNELDDFKLSTSIDQILKNPERFAEHFAENYLSRNFKKILDAKRLGIQFANKNMSLSEK